MSDVTVKNDCPDATWGIVENGDTIAPIPPPPNPENPMIVPRSVLSNPNILTIKLLNGDPQDPYYQINGGPKPPIILDSNNEFSITLPAERGPINVTIGDGQCDS